MRKNYLKAAELYLAAVTIEPESTGSHETTWLQAKRLMAVLKPSEEEQNLIAKAFSHLRSVYSNWSKQIEIRSGY